MTRSQKAKIELRRTADSGTVTREGSAVEGCRQTRERVAAARKCRQVTGSIISLFSEPETEIGTGAGVGARQPEQRILQSICGTMLKPSALLASFLEPSLVQSPRCLSCHLRNTPVLRSRNPLRSYATKSDGGKSAPTTSQHQSQENATPESSPHKVPTPTEDDPIPYLDRPIGSGIPPREGQNTGVDERSFGQRRDDFVDYGKHIERRKQLYGFGP